MGVGIRPPDDLQPLDPFGTPQAESSTWADYGRALVSGLYGAAGSTAAGVEYLTGAKPDSTLAGIREWGAQGSEAQVKKMSPYAQRRLNAPVLSTGKESMWGEGVGGAVSSLALKATQAAPSMAATVVPGGIAAKGLQVAGTGARVAGGVGTVVGGGTASVMSGGDVFSRISDSVIKTNDKELRQQSPYYRGLRELGFTETDAKDQLRKDAAGYMPVYVGLVTALTTKFGVESLVAQKAAGEAVKRTFLKGAGVGALGESTQEGAEGIAQALAGQLAEQRAGQRDSFDWAQISEDAIQGAIVGGTLGAGVGAVARGRPEEAKPTTGDADIDAAAAPATEEGGGPMTITVGPSAVEGEAPATQQDVINEAEDAARAEGAAVGQQILDMRGPDEKPDSPTEQAQPAVGGATAPVEGAQAEIELQRQAAQGVAEAPAVDADVQAALAPPEAEAPVAAPQPQETPVPDEEGGYDPDEFIDEDTDYGAPQTLPEVPRENFIPEVEQSLAKIGAASEAAPPEAAAAPVGAVAPDEALAAEPNRDPLIQGSPAEVPVSAGGQEAQAGLVEPDLGPEVPVSAGSNASDLPAQGPRVLPDLTPAPAPAAVAPAVTGPDRTGPRVSKKEAQRAAQGEGVVRLPEPRADLNADRKAFRPVLNKLVKAGAKLTPEMEEINSLLSTKNAFMGEKRERNNARYAELRRLVDQQNLDEIASREEAGEVVRQTEAEAEAKKAAEAAAESEAKADKLIRAAQYDEAVRSGNVDAMRGYATKLVAEAKKAKIEIPTVAGEELGPGLTHLVQARSLSTKGSKASLAEFMGSDFAYKQGETSLAREARRQGAAKQGGDQQAQIEAVAAEEAAEPSEYIEEEPTPPVRERAPVKVEEGAVTGRVSREGQFKLEERKTRKPKPAPGKESLMEKIRAKEAAERELEELQAKRRSNPENVTNPSPTEAQKEAGNFAKRRTIAAGLPVRIEQEKRGIASYGYIGGTKGADGDAIDIYIARPNGHATVYVIEQMDPQTGKFDEHKAVTGVDSEHEAARVYDKGFSDGSGPERMGRITPMSAYQFREWAKKPRSERAPRLDTEEQEAAAEAENKAVHKDEVAAAEAVVEQLTAEQQEEDTWLRNQIWESEKPNLKATPERNAFVAARNKVRSWVNRLSDSDWKYLRNEYRNVDAGMRFPQAMNTSTDPEKLQKLWQDDLDSRAAPLELEDLIGGQEETGTVPLKGLLTHHIETLREGLASGKLSQMHTTIMTHALKRIQALAPDVDVQVISEAQMRERWAQARPDWTGNLPAGFYDYNTDEIFIQSGYMAEGGNFQQNLLEAQIAIHEGAHAAYFRAIRSHPEARKTLETILASAQAQYAKDGLDDKAISYGLTNVDELVSEGFSNPRFQDFLKRVPLSPEAAKAAGLRNTGTTKLGLVSAWTSFVMSVKKWVFGAAMPHNALEGFLRITEHLDARTQAIGRSKPTLGKGQAATAPIFISKGLQEETSIRGKGARIAMRHFTIAARTLDQLRQHGRGLFWSPNGDALENVVAAMQRIAPWRRAKVEEGQKHAVDWGNLRKQQPTVAEAAENLAIDFTTHEYEPGMYPPPQKGKKAGDATASWQARAKAADMDKRFAALPKPVQDLMKRTSKYYRDMTNEIFKTTIKNQLDGLTTLSDKDKADIQSKILAGTITDADHKLVEQFVPKGVDADTLLNGLKPMKTLKGMYFPLMRHGEWVVQTRDPMPTDLMGGKLHNENTVAFREQKDKAARDKARAFAQAQGYKAGSIRKFYFDRKTGKQVTGLTAQTSLADYDVEYRVPLQLKGYYAFESATEAERFRRQYQGGTAREVVRRDSFDGGDDITTPQMKALKSQIEGRKDLQDGTKKMLSAAMDQAAARLMAGNRIQHRGLTRQNWRGASTDIARATLTYAEGASGLLARAKIMPEVRSHLDDMRKVMNATKDSKENPVREAVYKEVEKRINEDPSDKKQLPKWAQNVMSLTFLARLASPAYSIFNATQPQMVTWPVLAGRHGGMRAQGALIKAMWDIGAPKRIGSGIANTWRAGRNFNDIAIDTTDVLGSIRKNVAGDPNLTDMLDKLQERGAIDPQSGMELAAPVLTAKGPVSRVIAQTDRISRQLPVAVEAVNRAVSAVAAYRLGRADGMGHDQAVAYAFDTVQNTQGDYSAINEMGILRGERWAKPGLQFKKYAQMMTALLADMTKRSFGSMGPVEKRIARKQLMNIMAVQVAMAGTLGLPGLEIAKLTFLVLGALGFTDGWEEQENKLRDLADAAVGKTMGELVTKGVLSRAVGIDLSSRMSLADMWTFGEPKEYDREGTLAYLAQIVGGAPVGLGADMLEGSRLAADGEYGKALSKAFPVKFAADIVKATRGSLSGELSIPEAGLKVLGIRSAREAEHGESVGRSIKESKDKQKRRQAIVKRYIAADKSELPGLLREIKQFNESESSAGIKTPVRLKIFPKALDHIRKREADRRFRITGER